MDNLIKDNLSAKISTDNYMQGEAWTGFKELVLIKKEAESEDIMSFYFKDKNDSKLIKHKAGQFLPFKVKTDDEKYKNVIRTYSLSMMPNEDIYRITVKRVPDGLISNYLHDKLNEGDIIEARMPAGLFTLEKADKNKPLVFISAGVGITPLISMLYESVGKYPQITFIQAVQNATMQPFASDIKKITKNNNYKNYVFYNEPQEGDVEGKDYDYTGFVTKKWIEDNLDMNSQFYFCGPPPFMKAINTALIELGVDKERIHFESFERGKTML